MQMIHINLKLNIKFRKLTGVILNTSKQIKHITPLNCICCQLSIKSKFIGRLCTISNGLCTPSPSPCDPTIYLSLFCPKLKP